MNRFNVYLLLVAFFVTIAGCRKSLNPADYYAWNNKPNNPLSKWHKGKYYNFNAVYRPIDFMALSQLNGEQLSKEKMIELQQGLFCCRHFKISIQSKDTSDVLKYKLRTTDEYYERIKYLSNDITNHLFLIEGKDTLPCTFSHYERAYKLKSSATVMAFFERKKSGQSEQIPMKLILTTGGFNPSNLVFEYNENELKNIPNLTL